MEDNKNLEDNTCPIPSYKIIYNSETPCELYCEISTTNRFGAIFRTIKDAINVVEGNISGKGCLIAIDKDHITHYIMLDNLLYFKITVKEDNSKEE